MKFNIHGMFLLFTSFHLNVGDDQLVPLALYHILRDFYVNRSENFDLVICGKENRNITSLVNDVMREIDFPTTFIQIEDLSSKISVDKSTILFFNSIADYNQFHEQAKLTNRYVKDINILVYIEGVSKKDLEKIKEKNGHNVALLIRTETFLIHSEQQESNSLKLMIFDLTLRPNCHNRRWQVINTFSTLKRKWKTRAFAHEKFNNLRGCDMTIRTPLDVETDSESGKEGFERDKGFSPVVVEQICRNVNFTYEYGFLMDYPPASEQDDFLELESNSLENLHFNNGTEIITAPFMMNEEVILISRSVLYTDFIKILLPFDIETWCCLIGTLSVFAVTIVVLRFAPVKVRDFVIGQRVKTPMLNLV
jgi:hypothetical protein